MFDSHTPTEPQVLRPLDLTEVISTKAAAKMAGRTTVTIREWARQFNIGRQVAGRWLISAPAFLAFLEGDQEALRLYLAGDRQSPRVRHYFAKASSLSREEV